MCPPQITTWDKAHLAGRIDAFDMTDAVAAFVPEMRARGSELIIALAHTGIAGAARVGMEENAAQHIARIPGIDAMITGHLHQTFPGPAFKDLPGVDLDRATLFGVPTVMPGFWGSHLGVMDLELVREGSRWRVADHRVETRPIAVREQGRVVARAAARPDVLAEVEADHAATLAYVRKPVGRTDVGLDTYFALVSDTAALQFVADAQLWGARRLLAGTAHADLPLLSAVAPFKAGGGPDPRSIPTSRRASWRSGTSPTSTCIRTRCRPCGSPARSSRAGSNAPPASSCVCARPRSDRR